jgi:HK97 family phage major capsid protein
MPIDTKELRAARHKLIVDCRTMLDTADKDKRLLSAEERANYDKQWTAADGLRLQIEDADRRNTLEIEEELARKSQEEKTAKEKTAKPTEKRGFDTKRSSVEYRDAFSSFLLHGPEGQTVEQRALTAGEQVKGGYLYASEQFVNDLIANVVDQTKVRGLCRTMKVANADAISCPVLANRMAAAAWTSELGTPSTDSTLTFGKKTWTPHPLSKEILVSNTLLQKAPGAEGIVREELARIVAEANENGFLTGTGVQQPLGLFTASNDGIPTSRDYSTGNSTTAVVMDAVKGTRYQLKAQYLPNAQWIMHRDVAFHLAKLKDGDGRYLWQDSVAADEPDRLMGRPVILSEFAPNTFTTGKYMAILGDFSNYWIVDAMDMTVARATELYIRTNQTWFGVRMATDGGPARSEAFCRLTLG